MNPGKLNKRIKIFKFNPEGIEDGAGGYNENFDTEEGWELLTEVWANITPLSGKAFEEAQQAQSEVTHRITIRYNKNIDRTMLIKYQERRFDIVHIINKNEANNYMEIRCVERI